MNIIIAGGGKVGSELTGKLSAEGHEEIICLDKPKMGVYIPKMIWKEMYHFSKDSVILCLASTHYNGSEYIRDYEDYKKLVK